MNPKILITLPVTPNQGMNSTPPAKQTGIPITTQKASAGRKNKPNTLKTVASALSIGAVLLASPALAAGDAEKGKKVFKKCQACHMVGEGAKNRVGPILTGVVGRTAGSVEGYKYGKSIVKAGEGGLVWTEEEIFAYLKNPKKYLRKRLDDKKAKSKMSFKLKKEGQREDVIAYLKTFSN